MAKDFYPMLWCISESSRAKHGVSLAFVRDRWLFEGCPRNSGSVGSDSGESFRFGIAAGGALRQIGECNNNYLGDNDTWGFSQNTEVLEWNDNYFTVIFSSNRLNDVTQGGALVISTFYNARMHDNYDGGATNGYYYGSGFAKFPNAIAVYGNESYGKMRAAGSSTVFHTVRIWTAMSASNWSGYDQIDLPNYHNDEGESMHMIQERLFVGGSKDRVLQYEYMDGSGWVRVEDIFPSLPQDSTCFGKSISSFKDDENSLYITAEDRRLYKFTFDGTSWTEADYVSQSGISVGDKYGEVVKCQHGFIFVGAKQHNYDENDADYKQDAGALYIYNQSDMTLFRKMVMPDTMNIGGGSSYTRRWMGQDFGTNVAFNGEYLFVSASSADNQGQSGFADQGITLMFKFYDPATLREVKSKVFLIS